MSINLKIEKQHVYLIAAILVFLIGVGVVIALGNTPNPSVHGHDVGEIEGGVGGFIPSSYKGEQSITFPNGMIMKWGYTSYSNRIVTFSTPFPNSCSNVIVSPVIFSGTACDYDSGVLTGSVSKTGFQIYARLPSRFSGWYWQARGY